MIMQRLFIALGFFVLATGVYHGVVGVFEALTIYPEDNAEAIHLWFLAIVTLFSAIGFATLYWLFPRWRLWQPPQFPQALFQKIWRFAYWLGIASLLAHLALFAMRWVVYQQ